MRSMYRVCVIVTLLCLLSSCVRHRGGGTNQQLLKIDSMSMCDSDTLFSSPTEKKLFPNVDGIFDDFFSLFLVDESLRDERIDFPLQYQNRISGHDTVFMSEEWKNHALLPMEVEIYTSIYEKETDMMLEGDTTLRSVFVEYILMEQNKVFTLHFSKNTDEWRLVRVVENELGKYVHGDFISFYHQFVTDSVYQSLHVQDPLVFITSDPEDDFNVLEATIGREQWFAFRPALPIGKLVNINYTARASAVVSRSRILQLKNISTGSITNLYFRLRSGEWKLVRLEDTSN